MPVFFFFGGGRVLKGALFSKVEVGFIEQSGGHLGLLGASAFAFEVVFWDSRSCYLQVGAHVSLWRTASALVPEDSVHLETRSLHSLDLAGGEAG